MNIHDQQEIYDLAKCIYVDDPTTTLEAAVARAVDWHIRAWEVVDLEIKAMDRRLGSRP